MTDPIAALRAFPEKVDDPKQELGPLIDVEARLRNQPEPVPASSHRMDISGGQTGVAVAGNVGYIVNGRITGDPSKLRADYLQRLRKRCSELVLDSLHHRKSEDKLEVRLDQVYTLLAVNISIERERLRGPNIRLLNLRNYVGQHNGDQLMPDARRDYVRWPLTDQIQGYEDLPGLSIVNDAGAVPFAQIPFDLFTDIFSRQDNSSSSAFNRIWLNQRYRPTELIFFGPALVTDAVADNQNLVLLGEPGSGKSTALYYLAWNLAEAALTESFNLPGQLAGWERLGKNGLLLPVLCGLLPFARSLGALPGSAGSADDLWFYIREQLESGDRYPGLADVVHDDLRAGRVLLLLDGLDEVASPELRSKVVRAVQLFAKDYEQCRIVVTCRARAYNGNQNVNWRLDSWPTATLTEWNATQIHHFIEAWYTKAAARGSHAKARMQQRAKVMQQAISTNDDLHNLARRPLLLTIMALVHLNDGRLPENRVTLYSRCIDLLLDQWKLRGHEPNDFDTLMEYIGLPDQNPRTLRPLLEKAAFEAHADSTPGSAGGLTRERLRLLVVDKLAELRHSEPREGAERFLEYADLRAGLLQVSDAGDTYVFPHPTIQEYLAGMKIVNDSAPMKEIMARRNDERWRMPILLGLGHLVSEQKLEVPLYLLLELILMKNRSEDIQHRDILFAAEVAADLGWKRLAQGSASFELLRRELASALIRVLETDTLPAADRVRAGVLLGDLGDARDGVCTLPPKMVSLRGGRFIIGTTTEEAQQRQPIYEQSLGAFGHEKLQAEINTQQLTVSTFEIACYPLTNAQYQRFWQAGGYQEATWWDRTGLKWLQRDDMATRGLYAWQQRQHKNQPEFWDHPRFGNARPNHPVVGISWYEAMAFCRWMSENNEDNPEGYQYRLLGEAEWEFAARGSRRRPYPWGSGDPDPNRANFDTMYRGTTAVGCFKLGATPQDVFDLTGNVWEWTSSIYEDYPYRPDNKCEVSDHPCDKRFTIRGGSWDSNAISLRASYRFSVPPDAFYYCLGFRIARSRPPRRDRAPQEKITKDALK